VAVGSEAVTERWCSEIPALSTDPKSDLTGRTNDEDRVNRVRAGYCEAFMRLPGVVSFGMTRLSAWSRRMGEEAPASDKLLDFAISVGVVDESGLPAGPLFIEGVPVVVRVVGLPRRVATDATVVQG
jgi:hypothetical protein